MAAENPAPTAVSKIEQYMTADNETVQKVEKTGGMADLTKLKTQLESLEYKDERDNWCNQIAEAECIHLKQELAVCCADKWLMRCVPPYLTWLACKSEAARAFSEVYDKMKIKEYILMMDEASATGEKPDLISSRVTAPLFSEHDEPLRGKAV